MDLGVTIARLLLKYSMGTADETKPTTPGDARLLEVGEIIEDGDLHWNPKMKH